MADFFTFAQNVLPELLEGTQITIMLTLGALLLGFLIGLPLAVLRLSSNPWLNFLVKGYLTVFRGTPLLVQLFVVYYGLPELGINFSRMAAAYIALGLNSSAYQAEYFRGAIQAVGSGQMKAAKGIGMSKFKALRYIVFPQALRLAIPAWSNEMISMVKYTAVVFVIAVPDLMGQAKMINSRLFAPISTYILVALVYFILVGLATWGLHLVSKKLAIPGLSIDMESH